MTTKKTTEQTEALARLAEWLKDGDTVYTILRHVSTSGMSRSISLLYIKADPKDPTGVSMGWLSYNVAKALKMRHDDKREAVKINGAGMDMGFALVEDLAYALGIKLHQRWL